jgi:hypothetical protein
MKHYVDGKSCPTFKLKSERSGYVKHICLICSRVCNPKKASGSIENMIQKHLKSKIHCDKTKMQEEVHSGSKNLDWPSSYDFFQEQNNHSTNYAEPLMDSTNSASSSSYHEPFINNHDCETVYVPMDPPIFQTALSKFIQNHSEPLIGTEYIVEFIDGYKCFLCDRPKRRSTAPPIHHLKSKKHQERYLNFNFPTVLEFINKMENRIDVANVVFIASKRVKLDLMKEASASIRNRFGFMPPKFWNQSVLQTDHGKLTRWIDDEDHCNEKNFPQIMSMFCEDIVKSMMIESVARLFPSNIDWNPFPQAKEPSNEDKDYDDESSDSEDDISNEIPVIKDPQTSDSEDMKQLADADFKVLLDNFDSLKPQEQQRLVAHIKEKGAEKFDDLRKILSDEGAGHLQIALED